MKGNRPTLFFKSFKVWQVVVPVRKDALGASLDDGAAWPEMPIHLVEGTTSEGFTAVGECARGTPCSIVENTLTALLRVNLLAVAPATAWMRLYDSSELPSGYPVWTKGEGSSQQKAIAEAVGNSSLYPVWSWSAADSASYGLFESLWLDAVGKHSGLPACQLLGGAVQKKISVDFWASRPSSKDLLALIDEARERQLTGMKIKSDGKGDAVVTLSKLHEKLPPDFRFTIDAMCSWRSWRESQQLWKLIADLPCTVQIEDPFPYANSQDWRKVRQMNHAAIICHARSEEVLRTALREDMADAFNLGGGSAYEFIKLACVAEFHGKDCWHGSGMELGVMQSVHLHAASAARNCRLASDIQSEWIRENILIRPRFEYDGDGIVVCDRPGLGVDLDHEAIKGYAKEQHTIR